MDNSSNKSISKYVKNSSLYTYETSITGQEKQKADVYEFYYTPKTTDYVAQDIINGIEGYTQSVTQKDDQDDAEGTDQKVPGRLRKHHSAGGDA